MSEQRLPQVESLLQEPSIRRYFALISRPVVVSIVRSVLDQERTRWQEGTPLSSSSDVINFIQSECRSYYRKSTIGVINATGTIIHTNLGRSPLSSHIWEQAQRSQTGYCSLEFDLTKGKRGERNTFVNDLLCEATGAQAACIVNNNASALFLVLSAFAKRKEVIVSRGELVQIGGGFRIPDILKQSGAKLVEIGTTNITTLDDYTQALSERTKMVLAVHRSNFALRGFTSNPTTKELRSTLPQEVLLYVDQGSGVLKTPKKGEIPVSTHLAHGADVVSFSCDKAFGSVQAGAIVGNKEIIEKLLKHPLYRILRPGKTTLSLLEHSLIAFLNKEESRIDSLGNKTIEELFSLGKEIINDIDDQRLQIIKAPMTYGGGSSPDEYFDGVALQFDVGKQSSKALRYMRDRDTPIIGIIEDNKVLFHLGTLFDEDVSELKVALNELVEKF